MNALRTVIVEDEPHARTNLREFVTAVEWLDLVGEAADGAEAVRLIDRARPDLVFLDVSLPEFSGLEVISRIRHTPDVVFTTAYDRFALTAFEVGALDYLLKPFGKKRFDNMLERVQKRLQIKVPATERARTAFDSPLRRLFARTREGIEPIDIGAIVHISASGDYVDVYSNGRRHLLHMSMNELASRLDPDVFRQVHRSHIVNIDAIEKIVPFDQRRLMIRLKNGDEVVASRAGSDGLRSLIR
jgi:two-component system LytT family response regulator